MSEPGEPSLSYIYRPRSLVRRFVHHTLHLPAFYTAVFMFLIVLVGSVVCALDLAPKDSIFADKHNIVNIYMVKYSWGWTLLLLIPTTVFPAALYSGFQRGLIMRHLSRLLVSHCIWWTVTNLFVAIDSNVGECEIDSITNRYKCIHSGHQWLGFDISGHVFLLTYCVFVIKEEAANIKLEVWYEFENTLDREHHVTDKLKAREVLLKLHGWCSWFVEPLELMNLALMLVWVFMAACTSIYFHTMAEKVLGFSIALTAWYLTYHWLYGRFKYAPCKPDEGCFHPIRMK